MQSQYSLFADEAVQLVHDAEGGIRYHPACVPEEVVAGWFAALLPLVPWRSERRPMYDRIVAVPRSSSARRLADPATGFGADPASDLARDAATNPAPGLDPSTDPASMFHVKQSTQCSATKEQMFHVKHSESVPAEGFAPAATAASAAKGVR